MCIENFTFIILKYYIQISLINIFLSDKIQNLKNEVSKNDKKARKQLNVEIVVLETELERKHDAELKLLVYLF